MSTIELKNILIQRISEIQDKSFIEAIRTILDARAESKTLYLTPEMTNEIMASRKIIWSHRAKIKRYEILEFYIERNT